MNGAELKIVSRFDLKIIKGGMPASAGFELEAKAILGEAMQFCTLFTAITLPWNCRIVEGHYGD